MEEVLKIKTDKKMFFMQYLTIKKPYLDLVVSSMLKKEVHIPMKALNVFALLLFYNYQYRDMDEETRWKTMFDNKHREEYMSFLNINYSHLNTYFSLLRNYKMLDGKKINEVFVIYPDKNEFELIFKFSLNGEK